MNQFLKAVATDPLLGLLFPFLALIPIAAVLASLVKFYDVWKRYGYAIARSLRSPLTLLIGFFVWCLPLPFFNGWAFLALCFAWFVAHWAHDRERTEALAAAFGQLFLWVFRALRNLVRERLAEAARVRASAPNSSKQGYATFAGLGSPPANAAEIGRNISWKLLALISGLVALAAFVSFVLVPGWDRLTHLGQPSREVLREQRDAAKRAVEVERKAAEIGFQEIEIYHERRENIRRNVERAHEQVENSPHETLAFLTAWRDADRELCASLAAGAVNGSGA